MSGGLHGQCHAEPHPDQLEPGYLPAQSPFGGIRPSGKGAAMEPRCGVPDQLARLHLERSEAVEAPYLRLRLQQMHISGRRENLKKKKQFNYKRTEN